MEAETTLEQRTGTLYKGVVFEPKAVYDGNEKKLYTFDQSLSRSQQAGLERHPRPSEVFGLLIANIEGKLTPKEKAVADDMLKSYDEWMSLVVLRKGNELSLYYDPENLVWNGGKYEVQGELRYAEEKKFDVKGLPSENLVDIQRINKKCPQLVETLWTRPYKNLPQQMKDNAALWLPPGGQIWPVGRGNCRGRFIVFCYGCEYGASRGVVVAPKKLTKTTKQMPEEKVNEILLSFDKYIGDFGQKQYQQDKQAAVRELLKLYKGQK